MVNMTANTRPGQAAGILHRIADRAGRPVLHGDGVAVAVGEHHFYAAVHFSDEYHGADDKRIGAVLAAIDKQAGGFLYPLYHTGRAVDLARELAVHRPDAHGVAAVDIEGVFYDARLLARVLRAVGGQVQIRAVRRDVYGHGGRPLRIERADVRVYVSALNPTNIDPALTPEAWG